mgnify:CR=1 FL=1
MPDARQSRKVLKEKRLPAGSLGGPTPRAYLPQLSFRPVILLNTGLNMASAMQPDREAFLAQPWVATLRTLGETPIALLITVVVSMAVLGWGMGKPGTLVEKIADSALGPICSVVLVTGAGGMFGGVLRATGIGDALAESLNGIGLPVIVAAYLIAQLVRLAQGSATVALTTAAALMVPAVEAGGFNELQLALIVVATAAGSVFGSHVNDSGFWLVSRFLNMDEKTTLKTWTVMETLLGTIAFLIVATASAILVPCEKPTSAVASARTPLCSCQCRTESTNCGSTALIRCCSLWSCCTVSLNQ